VKVPWSLIGRIALVAIGVPLAIWYVEHQETAKIGTPCTKELIGECWGPEQRIYCMDGTWVAEPCRGPNGCSLAGKDKDNMSAILCDTSKNLAGDACLHEDESFCSSGNRDLLVCRQHKLQLTTCARGCQQSAGGKASCTPAP